MARKPQPKRKKPSGQRLPQDAREILEGFIADILYKIMVSMIKADSVAPKIPGIEKAAKTEEQMRQIAAVAAKHYMQRANPSPNKLSEDEVEDLKKESIEFALKHFKDESET